MIEVDQKEIFSANAARYDRYEDMAQMGELNEACVLDNLKQRYQSNLIYVRFLYVCVWFVYFLFLFFLKLILELLWVVFNCSQSLQERSNLRG